MPPVREPHYSNAESWQKNVTASSSVCRWIRCCPLRNEDKGSLRVRSSGTPRGKSRLVTANTYDRSPTARQACIAHHGYKCAVCGFCFEEKYGALGAGYIEVHHLNQVADIDEEHLIDPITDLRPVCANCHRMLHKQRPPPVHRRTQAA
ncbi:HNH endonuclease [Paraburkholderia sp. RL17-347-BIC-D]|uniref:HNH endonuclease n=1 Tax=Paraburkholderia sp. RL17-347-BIC-D TaxID=3031632 RepID=UPI0038BC33E2